MIHKPGQYYAGFPLSPQPNRNRKKNKQTAHLILPIAGLVILLVIVGLAVVTQNSTTDDRRGTTEPPNQNSPEPIRVKNMPSIFNVVIDATGSMTEDDFTEAKAAAAALGLVLNKKAEQYGGDWADLLSVNFFGGSDEYTGTEFINCSNDSDVAGMVQFLEEKPHPRYQHTAIYDAIDMARLEIMELDSRLFADYLKHILIITDGIDTGSPADVRQRVQDMFPLTKINLFIIGVGPNADVSSFESVADHVIHIEDFAKLAAVLLELAKSTPAT